MLSRSNLRNALLAGVAVAAVISTAAQAQTGPVNFDIASGDLNTALASYAKQSGVELFYQSRVVEGRSTQGLHGAFAPREALDQLLKGTGLVLAMDQSGALVVKEASAPQSGSAAGDGADAGTVQALVVTAQKREENIQDVPIAMSAFTQEDLTRSQVAGGPDLMTQVPNMTFTKTNFNSYSIQIRGIGTQAISATTDPAVAVAFNNTPFVRNHFFEQEFYDLERVEVLRGPQGTLYGRNATAGVVNVISAKPKFTYEAKLSADVANYSSRRLEGMVNVPLVEDKVALRLAGAWTKREGYDTNQITGSQIDGRDLWSTRLSLRFAPTDALDVNLIWEHFQEDDDRLRSGKQLCHQDDRTEIQGHEVPPINGYSALFSQGCLPASLYSPDSFEAPNGYSLPYYLPLGALNLPTQPDFNPYASLVQSRDLRVVESTVDPKYRAKSDLFELQWSLDLSNSLTLTSETSYNADFIFSTQDFNRFNTASGAFQSGTLTRAGVVDENGVFCDPQIGCADRVVAVDLATANSRQFSQEFRLSSNYDGPMNFSVGANFLRYDTEDKYYVFINTVTLQAAAAFYTGLPTGSNVAAGPMPPWVNGVSDNHECLPNGMIEPDPRQVYSVIGCVYIDPNPIGSLNDQGHNYFLSRNPYKLISYAAFGEIYYDITDDLKITGGLRWTVDKKQAPRIPSWLLGAGTAGYPVEEVVDQEWREPTGRLTVDWKPDLAFTDATMVYASFAHGYKAGGANPPPPGVVTYQTSQFGEEALHELVTKPKTFEPEFVNAFEVGAKNTLLDGKVTLNADAFYYDYTDYQISQIIDRSAVNYNFDADIWGLELEADWRPVENLRLGFKGGYENTKVADGSQAIDIMDRTAGKEGWIVVRPFPTQASNCVLPIETASGQGGVLTNAPNSYVNGNPGPCEAAYLFGFDPVTNETYQPNPTANSAQFYFPGYAGYDPTVDVGQNNGEGFFKDLSGNELPNAPHFTATITADYTIPLPNDWLATLHTDLYYQSEAWTRIFNTPGYDKLKAYTNVNLAAIFSNEDAGWKVMAYVKNVLDRDSITGAFLNSDDTGLTTNVFLTEPRLYGLRVTKEFTGGPWWTGANSNQTGPYPLIVELSGQVQRQDAPYETLTPGFSGNFPKTLDIFAHPQNRDLDSGDGRELKLTYRPQSGPWMVSASFRYGRTNNGVTRLHAQENGDTVCVAGGPFAFICPELNIYVTAQNWADASARDHEEHKVADFNVGKDVGLGGLGSTLMLGLRYAKLESQTLTSSDGFPDWNIVAGGVVAGGFIGTLYDSSARRFTGNLDAEREFNGAGPMLTWDASEELWGNADTGHVDLDWTISGGMLFGKQKTRISGEEETGVFYGPYLDNPRTLTMVETTPIDISRSKSVNVPVVDLRLGLSYEIQRIKIGTGYRWERYYDALDAGYPEHKSYDRTIDGPYFKIAVGFGG